MISEVESKIPKCPACGGTIAYLRINVVDPFPCTSCGHQLMVPKTYNKTLRVFPVILAAAIAVAATVRYWGHAPRTDAGVWHSVALFFLTYLVTMFAATLFGVIFVKRIFPPKLEDYDEYSKQAHYTPL